MVEQKKARFYMPCAACQRAFVLVAAMACVAMTSNAAEHSAPQAYQLNLANVSPYRLLNQESHAPLPVPGPDTARPKRLAELPFAAQVDSAARSAALDPALVHALIHVESRHNPVARSPKGALGLMQVLPGTASRYGIDDPIRSVDANLRAGTSYLRDLMNMFDGRIDLVLAAYNAGENAVVRHGLRIPHYRETQQYVPAVLEKYREWQEPPPAEPQTSHRVVYLPGTLLESAVRPESRR